LAWLRKALLEKYLKGSRVETLILERDGKGKKIGLLSADVQEDAEMQAIPPILESTWKSSEQRWRHFSPVKVGISGGQTTVHVFALKSHINSVQKIR